MTATIERELVEQDGLVVDPDTGEIIGMVDVKEEFHVVDDDSAEWVLEKLSEHEAEVRALELRKQALVANLDAMIKDKQRHVDFLHYRFDKELEDYASVALAHSKEKHIKTPWGRLSFRRSPDTRRVREGRLQDALAWAEEYCPDAVKHPDPVLLISKVPVAAMPQDLFETIEGENKFTITTGAKG